MEETAYKQWWPLHRRTALGEPLSAEEQVRYEVGVRQLEAEKPPIQSSIDKFQQTSEKIKQVEAERLRLEDVIQLIHKVQSAYRRSNEIDYR